MDTLVQLLVTAILVEAIWETLKMVWQKGKLNINSLGALLTGLAISISLELDILKMLGLESRIYIVGIIATGILISRGSNAVHDLIKKLNSGGGE